MKNGKVTGSKVDGFQLTGLEDQESSKPTPEKTSRLKDFKKSVSNWLSKHNDLKDKKLWDYLDLTGKLALPIILAATTFFWNVKTNDDATKQYRQGLVKDYVESVKGLLLDYYHKTGNFPEIKAEEVQAFLKSKTAATLKALNADVVDDQQTTVLINFLRESGIGFIAYEGKYQTDTPQDICSEDPVNFKTVLKTIDFSRFLCSIDLAKVELNKSDLHLIILDNANLFQAELQEVNFLNADLERANLSQSKLMGADLTLANLRDALLNSANLENANLSRANLTRANMSSEMPKYNPAIGKIITPKTVLINAVLEGANLMRATLNKVDLSGANLKPFGIEVEKIEQERINLHNLIKSKKIETKSPQIAKSPSPIIPVNLRNADLSEANLSSADLTMANLRGANLVGATIDNKSQFKSAIYDQYTCFSSDNFPSFKKQPIPFLHLKLVKSDSLWGNGSKLQWIESPLNKILSFFTQPVSSIEFHPNDHKMLFIRTLVKNEEFDKQAQSKCKVEGDILVRKKTTTLNLIGADLRGADLRNADLRNVDLRGAKLLGADLRGADLTGSKNNKDTDLSNAIYDGDTQLPYFSNDDDAQQDKKDVKQDKKGTKQNEKGATQDEKGMWKIILGADLLTGMQPVQDFKSAVKLISEIQDEIAAKKRMWKISPEANLAVLIGKGADLSGQDLTEEDLHKSNLQNANLANVQLDRWTKLEGAIYDQDTNLPFSKAEAKSRKMVYSPHQNESKKDRRDGAGKPVDLQDKTLDGVDFSQIDLTKANMQNANLVNAILLRSILIQANLKSSDLTKAILRRANLKGANLTDADLIRADLRWADLTDADLRRADLNCADLRWAKLKGANLKGAINQNTANVKGVDLTKVIGVDKTTIIGGQYQSSCQDNKDK